MELLATRALRLNEARINYKFLFCCGYYSICSAIIFASYGINTKFIDVISHMILIGCRLADVAGNGDRQVNGIIKQSSGVLRAARSGKLEGFVRPFSIVEFFCFVPKGIFL